MSHSGSPVPIPTPVSSAVTPRKNPGSGKGAQDLSEADRAKLKRKMEIKAAERAKELFFYKEAQKIPIQLPPRIEQFYDENLLQYTPDFIAKQSLKAKHIQSKMTTHNLDRNFNLNTRLDHNESRASSSTASFNQFNVHINDNPAFQSIPAFQVRSKPKPRHAKPSASKNTAAPADAHQDQEALDELDFLLVGGAGGTGNNTTSHFGYSMRPTGDVYDHLGDKEERKKRQQRQFYLQNRSESQSPQIVNLKRREDALLTTLGIPVSLFIKSSWELRTLWLRREAGKYYLEKYLKPNTANSAEDTSVFSSLFSLGNKTKTSSPSSGNISQNQKRGSKTSAGENAGVERFYYNLEDMLADSNDANIQNNAANRNVIYYHKLTPALLREINENIANKDQPLPPVLGKVVRKGPPILPEPPYSDSDIESFDSFDSCSADGQEDDDDDDFDLQSGNLGHVAITEETESAASNDARMNSITSNVEVPPNNDKSGSEVVSSGDGNNSHQQHHHHHHGYHHSEDGNGNLFSHVEHFDCADNDLNPNYANLSGKKSVQKLTNLLNKHNSANAAKESHIRDNSNDMSFGNSPRSQNNLSPAIFRPPFAPGLCTGETTTDGAKRVEVPNNVRSGVEEDDEQVELMPPVYQPFPFAYTELIENDLVLAHNSKRYVFNGHDRHKHYPESRLEQRWAVRALHYNIVERPGRKTISNVEKEDMCEIMLFNSVSQQNLGSDDDNEEQCNNALCHDGAPVLKNTKPAFYAANRGKVPPKATAKKSSAQSNSNVNGMSLYNLENDLVVPPIQEVCYEHYYYYYAKPEEIYGVGAEYVSNPRNNAQRKQQSADASKETPLSAGASDGGQVANSVGDDSDAMLGGYKPVTEAEAEEIIASYKNSRMNTRENSEMFLPLGRGRAGSFLRPNSTLHRGDTHDTNGELCERSPPKTHLNGNSALRRSPMVSKKNSYIRRSNNIDIENNMDIYACHNFEDNVVEIPQSDKKPHDRTASRNDGSWNTPSNSFSISAAMSPNNHRTSVSTSLVNPELPSMSQMEGMLSNVQFSSPISGTLNAEGKATVYPVSIKESSAAGKKARGGTERALGDLHRKAGVSYDFYNEPANDALLQRMEVLSPFVNSPYSLTLDAMGGRDSEASGNVGYFRNDEGRNTTAPNSNEKSNSVSANNERRPPPS